MNLILPSFKIDKGLYADHSSGQLLMSDAEAEWFLEVERAWRATNPKLTPFQAREMFQLNPPADAIRGRLDRDQILAKVDMYALLAQYVPGPYRPLGNNRLQVRCPYHDDQTPSMTVWLDDKRWRCWVEQEGGTAIDMVMRSEGLAFLPALKKLSQMV